MPDTQREDARRAACPHRLRGECERVNGLLGWRHGTPMDRCDECFGLGPDSDDAAAWREGYAANVILRIKGQGAPLDSAELTRKMLRHFEDDEALDQWLLSAAPTAATVFELADVMADRPELVVKLLTRAMQLAGHLEWIRHNPCLFRRAMGKLKRKPGSVAAFVEFLGRDVQPPTLPSHYSLCIAAHNEDHGDLRNTIHSAMDSARPPAEVVIVDDGGLRPIAACRFDLPGVPIHIHRFRQRIGSGPAKAAAIHHAKYDHIILADGHVRFPTGYMGAVRCAQAMHPDALLCACSRDFPGRGGFVGWGARFELEEWGWAAKWRKAARWDEYVPRVPCLLGGVYVFRKQALEACGGYAYGLRGYGYEEESLSMRAHACGVDVRIIPALTIQHRYRRSRVLGDSAFRAELLANRRAGMSQVWGHDPVIEARRVRSHAEVLQMMEVSHGSDVAVAGPPGPETVSQRHL